MQSDKYSDILMGTFIGDALGSGTEGMGRGHIKSQFKTISGYINPASALRGKMQQWRKPGLYTSISQFLSLSAMLLIQKRGNPDAVTASLKHMIKDLPNPADYEIPLFRSPDYCERRFIQTARSGEESSKPVVPSIRIIPLSAAFLTLEENRSLTGTIKILGSFTCDPSSIAGALLYAALLRRIAQNPEINGRDIIGVAMDLSVSLSKAALEQSRAIFESGMNPDPLASSFMAYEPLFGAIRGLSSVSDAEKILCAAVNPGLLNPVTRATVNNPYLALPFAVMNFILFLDDPGSMLFSVAAEGGSAAAVTSLTGGLMGARFHHSMIPPPLQDNLVNKTRIATVLQAIRSKKITDAGMDDFITSEIQLTHKEHEERKAKMKHSKAQKPRRARETDNAALTRHIVESWTKLDKAKWKKEKRKKPEKEDDPA